MKQFFLSVVMLCALGSVAQRPVLEHLELVNGIATDNVYFVSQGEDRKMWFGTDVGISSFDGYKFTNYDYQDGLPTTEVFQIYTDSKKRKWILSINGTVSYFQHDSFHLVKKESRDWNRSLHSAIEGPEGDLYFTSGINEVLHIKPDGSQVQYHTASMPYRVFFTKTGRVRLLGMLGLYELVNDSFELIYDYDFSAYYPRSCDVPDGILIAEKNDLFKFDSTLHRIGKLPNDMVATFLSIENDKVLVGTRTGLLMANSIEELKRAKPILPEAVVSWAMFDDEGNLWVTTLGNGIYISKAPYVKLYDKQEGLEITEVKTIEHVPDINALFVGYRNGMFATVRDGEISNNSSQPTAIEPVMRFHSFPNHGSWIVTKSRLMYSDRFESARDPNFSSARILSNDIYIQGETVYLASNRLYRIPFDDLRSDLLPGEVPNNSINQEHLEDILIDHRAYVLGFDTKRNQLYAGTDFGLYVVLEDAVNLGDRNSLLKANINDLIYDEARDLLYVATTGKGLVVLRDQEILKTFTQRNNLSAGTCVSLHLDQSNNLWVGTTHGIDKIENPTTDSVAIRFGAQIGLTPMKIQDITSDSQHVYMATSYGLFQCHRNQVQFNYDVATPMLISDISAINGSGETSLPHNQNTIRFSFRTTSYKDMDELTYRYTLEGLSQSWETTREGSAQFNQLKPGDYTFKVMAINTAGVPSEARAISFTILKPFWQSTWFVAGSFIITSLLIGFIWMFRLNYVRRRHQMEQKLSEATIDKLELEKAYLVAEQKAGVMQMNPHFLFNSLNTIKGYYGQGKLKEANHFIGRFSKLLRRILESNKPFIPLEKECEFLEIYLELMQNRYDGVFTYSIINRCKPEAARHIPPMLIQPIVENAVIHGLASLNAGSITVCFEEQHNKLICTVTDTGVGINNSMRSGHQSVGLENIQDRLDILSKQYETPCDMKLISPVFESEHPGTRVIITLPLQS